MRLALREFGVLGLATSCFTNGPRGCGGRTLDLKPHWTLKGLFKKKYLQGFYRGPGGVKVS